MASIVQVSSRVGFTAGVATPSLSGVAAGNTVLIVTVGYDSGPDFEASASGYTADLQGPASSLSFTLLRQHNSAGGSVAPTVNTAGTTADYGHAVMIEVSGLTNAAPSQTSTNTNTNTTPTSGSTGALSQANGLAVALMCTDFSGAIGIDQPAGFTNRYLTQGSVNFPASFDTAITTSTSAIDVDWGTLASSILWRAGVAVYASDTPAGTSNLMLMGVG